jgi:ubiquinone/menaquinone biosynthesis C-methylase UbiE
MLKLAKKRKIQVVQGFGENLPFKNESFHFIQIVFTMEFIDDSHHFLKEAVRTLKKNGALILAFIDRKSRWGQYYQQNSSRRKFSHPPSPGEILEIFKRIGMEFQEAFQSLFQPPPDIRKKEDPRKGFGQGGFVVLRAIKKS